MILLSFIVFAMLSSYSQTSQVRKIKHVEKVHPGGLDFITQKLPSKVNRVSSNKGDIVLTYDNTLPDSVKIAFDYAKSIWESKLSNKLPIYIDIYFEPLDEDAAMVSEVSYQNFDNNTCCPFALASQLYNFQYGEPGGPDGCVIFNSELNWDCRFSGETTSEYNLPTMALRGIARCLGFGASIVGFEGDEYVYYTGFPTKFDTLLYSDTNRLSELTAASMEFADFVTSDNVFLDTPSKTYRIYAPKTFEQDRSLCCLQESGSIMSSDLGSGSIALAIDENTIDILRTIGWNFPPSEFLIKCNDIGDNGIGSSYTPHTFTLAKGSETISDYKWKFYLKNKAGEFVLISTSSSTEFTIDKINSPQNYHLNINGDIEGKIECIYTLDGQNYNATPFSVSLELKPNIISIDDISIKRKNYTFSLDFIVNYVGAEDISVEVEEEYSSLLQCYYFDEPFLAHVHIDDISSLYYSWVTIIVKNKYGSTYETIEFEPNYSANNNILDKKMMKLDNIMDLRIPIQMQLIKMDGTIVFDGDNQQYLSQSLTPGIYIKKEIFENGEIVISKTLVR